MNQLSSHVSRPTKKHQRLERLETEYQQNQERIRQLHRKNRDLVEKIRRFQTENTLTTDLNEERPFATKAIGRPRKPKSLARIVVDRIQRINRTRIGKYSIGFWARAIVMLVAVAMVCGFLGFVITRLIGLLIGA
jgi:hypothetical protein